MATARHFDVREALSNLQATGMEQDQAASLVKMLIFDAFFRARKKDLSLLGEDLRAAGMKQRQAESIAEILNELSKASGLPEEGAGENFAYMQILDIRERLAKVETKLNLLIWMAGLIAIPVVSAAVKILFGL